MCMSCLGSLCLSLFVQEVLSVNREKDVDDILGRKPGASKEGEGGGGASSSQDAVMTDAGAGDDEEAAALQAALAMSMSDNPDAPPPPAPTPKVRHSPTHPIMTASKDHEHL